MTTPTPEDLIPEVRAIEGEPGRYYVLSRSSPDEHLVDLFEFNLNGQCACEDFEFRCAPLLRRGAAPEPDLRCWHIKRARMYFTEYMLRAIQESRTRSSPATPRDAPG